jgi:hypothetical protein
MVSSRRRARVFALIAAACIAVAGVTVATAVHKSKRAVKGDRKASIAAGARLQRLLASHQPVVVYRGLDRHHPRSYGDLAFAPVARPSARVTSGMRCDRIAWAGGRGSCLTTTSGLGSATQITIFDGALRTLHRMKVAGVPSRTRISPDGRWGGYTTFVGGHSYGSPGQFSTATQIFDMRTGALLGNLESWKTVKDGRPFHKVDFNFWGLTFARDDDTFYATVASGKRTYLVRGSIRAKTMTVIHENVECPSLSPDGMRIAYKKKVGGPPAVWHFYVLDLETMRETPLAEQRTIDDQIAWLDDGHVMYDVDETTWVANADGSGAPRQLLAAANSPTIASGATSAPAL